MLRRVAWGVRRLSDVEVAKVVQGEVAEQLLKEKKKGAEAVEVLVGKLKAMKDRGDEVKTKAWAASLGYLAAADRKRRKSAATERAAQTLFDACVVNGTEPNAEVYSQLINCMSSYAGCRIAFDFMVLDGTLPDEQCMLTVLNMCAHHKETARHKAESLMSFVDHEGIDVTSIVWDRFLEIYCTAGDLPGAADVFLRMKTAGMPLTSHSYEYFLLACARSPNKSENFDTAELAVMQCYEQGLTLTDAATAHLMDIYVSHRSAKRAHRLYQNAQDQNKVSSRFLVSYAKLLRKEGHKKQSYSLRETARNRYKQTLSTYAPKKLAKLLAAEKKFKSKKQKTNTTNNNNRAKKPEKKKGKGVDIIGDAIRRHLRSEKEAATPPRRNTVTVE